jgi:NADPH:quinone reductase-like Zn-dependent oxidoreductase
MKAVRLHARGGLEQLVYEDARKPVPGTGHALVRVVATGITPTELTWDETYQTCDGAERIPSIPGHELCGVVEQLGSGVSGIQVGDEVYALTEFCRDGTAAEFVVVRTADLAPKPRTLNHTETAAVPLSGLTAWQGLFEHGRLLEGQTVLIHGGAGGVGSFAVQLAHWRKARVVATASAADLEFVKSLGADEVLDYAKDRFDERVQNIDLVFDVVGGETLDRSFSVLKRGGTLVTVAQPPSAEKAAAHGVRALYFIVEPGRKDLIDLANVIDAGYLKPIVEAVLPLQRAREAFERARAHKRGKLILSVSEPGSK